MHRSEHWGPPTHIPNGQQRNHQPPLLPQFSLPATQRSKAAQNHLHAPHVDPTEQACFHQEVNSSSLSHKLELTVYQWWFIQSHYSGLWESLMSSIRSPQNPTRSSHDTSISRSQKSLPSRVCAGKAALWAIMLAGTVAACVAWDPQTLPLAAP